MRQFVLPPRKLWLVVTALVALCVSLGLVNRRQEGVAARRLDPSAHAGMSRAEAVSMPASQASVWTDRFGDGWPDVARLDHPSDRENFVRWFTYLAESAYYQPAPRALLEVKDCAALIRYAYRNALVAHTRAWRQSASLRAEPGFSEVGKFGYPDWPLGRGLFRTAPGPFSPEDLERGVFQEFADAETMLRYNTFSISKNIAAARPGDVLFFHQPEQAEPFHSLLFVGRSHFQPQANDWIVYHTGDVNGQGGEVRHVPAGVLAEHPEPRWRPLEANPRFLGVYRFNILR